MNIGIDLNIGEVIAEAKGSIEKFKENKTYNKDAYDELLQKYASAITVIELLKSELDKAKSSGMPSKGDIEAAGAMLNLLGIDKLDAEGVARLKNMQNLFGDSDKK